MIFATKLLFSPFMKLSYETVFLTVASFSDNFFTGSPVQDAMSLKRYGLMCYFVPNEMKFPLVLYSVLLYYSWKTE